jgi:hypothetical protein
MANLFDKTGYNFNDTTGTITTLPNTAINQLNTVPSLLPSQWMIDDLNNNDTGGYHVNPVSNSCNTIWSSSNTLITITSGLQGSGNLTALWTTITSDIAQAVTLGGDYGFQGDFNLLNALLNFDKAKELVSNNPLTDYGQTTHRLAKLSPIMKSKLSKELLEFKLPKTSDSEDMVLVVVTGIKKEETLRNALVAGIVQLSQSRGLVDLLPTS